MQLATVIGHATSTIKHESMNGLRLVIVQPLNEARQAEADPLIVVDRLGSGTGDTVLLNNDSRSVRALVGSEKTPVRWYVAGIVDQ